MQIYVAITFIQVLVTFAIAAPLPLPKNSCVVHPDGTYDCNPVGNLANSIRSNAPCDREDIRCWNKVVLEYTNKVRKRKRVPKLILGSISQLNNANEHADYLSKKGKLIHQNLVEATKNVKCKHWVGGENLAFTYEKGDIAEACVNKWINSPSHYENLIRDWFEEMVVGFHFDKDGRVYCVQTFSLYNAFATYGSVNGKNCEAVRTSRK